MRRRWERIDKNVTGKKLLLLVLCPGTVLAPHRHLRTGKRNGQGRSRLKLSNYISVVCLWPCCGHDIMVNHILLQICTARCVATSSLLHDSLHHRARKFTVLSDVHMLWIGMQVGWAKGDRALLRLWAVIGQPIVHATCGPWDNCWMQSKFVNVFWTLYFFTLTGNVCKCYCS